VAWVAAAEAAQLDSDGAMAAFNSRELDRESKQSSLVDFEMEARPGCGPGET
jgi:hypothetical protein